RISSSVGSEARMRVSSATSPSSSGTFRSARTSTLLPATSTSRTERGSFIPRASQQLADEVDETARVAPLVVVPAEDLDHAPVDPRQVTVEDAGVRGVDDVSGDDRLVGVPENPGERPRVRLRLEQRVDLVRRSLATDLDDEVDHGARGDGRAHGHAVD